MRRWALFLLALPLMAGPVTVIRNATVLTVTKGAPERVLGPGRLDEPAERVAVARAAAHRMSQQGLRVIAFAAWCGGKSSFTA